MNREKVIQRLECIAEDRQKNCTGCEYSIFGLYPFCVHGIARDALSLLKEQEPVEPLTYYDLFICPVCKNALFRGQKFCYECGQAVKWDE